MKKAVVNVCIAFDPQNTLISLPYSFRSCHISFYLSGNSRGRSQQRLVLPFQRSHSSCVSQPMSWHWSIIESSFPRPSQGPVWSGKQQDEAAFWKKSLHHGNCFYLLSSLEAEGVEDSNDTGNYNGKGVCDQANKCFLFGSAHEPQTWETGWVWVKDKGLSVCSTAQALCSAQTNIGSIVLMPPPETSSTRRLELENKQLPNPNILAKVFACSSGNLEL